MELINEIPGEFLKKFQEYTGNTWLLCVALGALSCYAVFSKFDKSRFDALYEHRFGTHCL